MILDLTQFILASGAVGTASMAIAEGSKSVRIKPFGFGRVIKDLSWAEGALKVAYGNNHEDLLKSLYRTGRSKGDLPRILRQGIRIGMNKENAKNMAQGVGSIDPVKLSEIAGAIEEPKDLDENQKKLIGRFEIAADARIEAALAMAERAYTNGIRLIAFLIAIILSQGAAAGIFYSQETTTAANFAETYKFETFIVALIVGLTAVPLAPIAKDIATGLQSAAKAVRSAK